MAVILARVDSRLVHGQVVEGWAPLLRADTLLVVDRELAGDPLTSRVLAALERPGLEIRLTGPRDAARLLAGELRSRRVLVLFASPLRALEACDAGVEFGRLNLGNVHPSAESRPVTASVYLTREDARALRELSDRGVELEARAVPADRSPDLPAVLRREFGNAHG
ncbi:MAG: PTS sugar transporter subunit IIB [Deferrisomatales bacterium]